MARTLTFVLAEYLEDIVDRWSERIPTALLDDHSSDLDPQKGMCQQTVRSLLRAIVDEDQTKLDEITRCIGCVFATAGCHLADVQRWLLALRETVAPYLVSACHGDFATFLAATRALDECLNGMILVLAEAYPSFVARHENEYVHQLERRNRELERRATCDGLTGLYNRSYFQKRLREEVERGHRYARRVGLVLIDIDRFKELNDSRGHLAGDHALTTVASSIRHDVREVDVAVRYGGDEFAIVLPETAAEGGLRVAERIRSGIERANIPMVGYPGRITLSIGIATFPDDATDETDLIEKADRALYQSKRRGRNQISLAGGWGQTGLRPPVLSGVLSSSRWMPLTG